MLRVGRSLFGLIACLFLALGNLEAARPKLYVQESEHVRVVYYDPAHEYLVPHLIRSVENALKFDNQLFHYTPSQKITILFEDFGDYGHGAAGTVPVNFISVGLEPLSYIFETLPTNERISGIINHEMIHIVMGDNASRGDRFAREVFFGKIDPSADDPISMFYSSLTSPRHYSPRWYHEGIAAFMETWLSGGLGRALGGYDEMVFRAAVRDKAYIYNFVGLESEGTAIDFQVGANSYLYGTRFMTYLADKYGIDKLLEWVTRSDTSRRYFTSQFKNVYGKSLKEVWDQWIAAENEWQNANLERIRQYPVTKPRRLPFEMLGSISRTYFDPSTKTIFAAVQSVGHMAHLAALHTDSGKVESLQDVQGAGVYYVTSLAYDSVHRRIFYSSDNKNWRDLNVFDLNTRQARRLMKDTRTGDLVYNSTDQSLWGMRHSNGQSSLVRLVPPYTTVKPVYTFPYGTDLFDLDISPDGSALTGAIANMSGEQKLVRFQIEKLLKGEDSHEVLYDFVYNSPENFVYSPDGHYLYGNSYQTGVSNIFRYDFENKKMEVLSNAETGFFRPLPLPDGRLIAFEYTAKGFVPGVVPTVALNDVNAINYLGQDLFNKTPVLKTWKLPPPSSIETEKVITSTGSYSPLRATRPISVYPIVQGYKDTAAGGLRMDFLDGLRLSGGDVTASYSPSTAQPPKERFHFGLNAHLWNWTISSYYNRSDFYDLFGPTKVSRKGFSLKVGQDKNLLFDTPRTVDLNWSVAGYAGLDMLPDYQNVASPVSQFYIASISLKYSRLERSLGAVDDEKGTEWKLDSELTYAGHKAYPAIYGTFDRGFLLPIAHNSSLWFRSSLGKAFGNPDDPFANFYFGGFGNNWVDHQEVSRYREYYSFPGVNLDEIGSTSFGKLLTEWNLPPVHFRRAGTTALYVNWARLTLFSSGLVTGLGNPSNRSAYGDFGAQLDFRTVLFTYFNSTFSVGYASAINNQGRTTGEYMISLKIL